jgi:aspartyl-tRNA(Asn)/glutamyl-tRNA(Gln) amidotransferase subunit A
MMMKNGDMTAVAAALAQGQITASELLARHLADIKRLQPDLNCFVDVDESGAGRAAAAADQRRRQGAPLSAIDGLPIALKDNINVEGLATRNGSRRLHPVAEDAAVSRKLRAAGVVILGKLNMDECAIGGTTDNPHFGRTHNPWRRGFMPGGSSGGAASAVAAGLACAALGRHLGLGPITRRLLRHRRPEGDPGPDRYGWYCPVKQNAGSCRSDLSQCP